MQEMLKDNYKKIAIIKKFHFLGTKNRYDKTEIEINLTFTPKTIIVVAISSRDNYSYGGRACSDDHKTKEKAGYIGSYTWLWITNISNKSFTVDYYNNSSIAHISSIIAIE